MSRESRFLRFALRKRAGPENLLWATLGLQGRDSISPREHGDWGNYLDPSMARTGAANPNPNSSEVLRVKSGLPASDPNPLGGRATRFDAGLTLVYHRRFGLFSEARLPGVHGSIDRRFCSAGLPLGRGTT